SDFGAELIFEVEDQGPGLSEADQHSIFDKGVSSKEGEAHGYGLHLVRQWVQRFRGMITVETAESGGARFIVYLPKEQQQS
ncbi:MAG: sensor histidine kinase, partial [Gammaproteobacteria bacterium]